MNFGGHWVFCFPMPALLFGRGNWENDIFACGKNDIGLWPTILPLRGNDIHACGMNGGG